jgi:peptidoglycan/xylan/chitin deacetylase (PgdA/CDA1 family)
MKWVRLPLSGSRKILCVLALAAGATLLLPNAALARRQRLVRAGVSQAGRELIFTVRSAKPISLSQLESHPDPRRAASRYLCFELSADPTAPPVRLCLGGRRVRRRLGFEQVNPVGRPTQLTTIPATVKRPQAQKLVVSLEPRDATLSPQRYRWRVISSSGCEPGGGCREALPATGTDAFRLRPVRAVGCTGGSTGLVTNGSRERKVVALTFDDGPSDYTDDFLAVLREKDVPATFFEVGQVMPGREGTMREILAQGSEIGDHTMDHVEFPGYEQIAGAAARIKAYTHFQPCLFRPPGGAVDDGVVATAGSLGMRTITWDVDPRDWSNPGTEAIYAGVVGYVQPGSIVVMHDGGGPRSETLAALPRIIDTLRGRGYRFATVTDLLGGRILYRPYG